MSDSNFVGGYYRLSSSEPVLTNSCSSFIVAVFMQRRYICILKLAHMHTHRRRNRDASLRKFRRWRRVFIRWFARSFFRSFVPSFVRPSEHSSVRPLGGTGPVIGPKFLAPLDRPKIIHPHVPRGSSQTFLCDILCCRYLYLIHEVKLA